MMSFGTSSSSTFQPMTIELRSPSGVIATKQVTSNDSWGVDLTGVPHGTQLTATVTDTGYYTDSATTTY
ncbi:MAG: hypothetical protein WBC12_01860, partial [Candidatus Saccharimonas aalborgensis]